MGLKFKLRNQGLVMYIHQCDVCGVITYTLKNATYMLISAY